MLKSCVSFGLDENFGIIYAHIVAFVMLFNVLKVFLSSFLEISEEGIILDCVIEDQVDTPRILLSVPIMN